MLRKALLWLTGLLALVLVIAGTQYIASESGEVVVLETHDEAGAVHRTRLWVVDHDGSAWLRAGNPSGGWFPRLSARPDVVVVRGGEAIPWRAVPAPEARDTINGLMHEKYGFADTLIEFVEGGWTPVAVRLDPR